MDIRTDDTEQLYAVHGSTLTFGATPAPAHPIADLYRAKAREAWQRHHEGQRRPGESVLGGWSDVARRMERKAREIEQAAAEDSPDVVRLIP